LLKAVERTSRVAAAALPFAVKKPRQNLSRRRTNESAAVTRFRLLLVFRLIVLKEDDEIVGIDIVERRPRPFLKHIGIDLVGAQK
jgi:hypothetical protein